jgi:hypothetical protein
MCALLRTIHGAPGQFRVIAPQMTLARRLLDSFDPLQAGS